MSNRLHVLVLGGTGFLGEPLRRQLIERDGARLSLVVHRQEPSDVPSDTRLLRGRLGSFDLNWCRDDPPQWVIHCARLSGRGVAGRLLAAWRGRVANRRLIATLAALPSPPRVIYASGSLMYGSHGDDWVDEQTPLRPVSFAREYVLAERPFLRPPARLPVVLVRPGWVLGDGSWFRTFYLDRIRADQAVPIYGEGRNWMTFIHREDCAAMIRWVAARATSGTAVRNLAPGEPVRQLDFAEALAKELSLPTRGWTLKSLRRPFDRAVEDAFASSIRLRSRHAAWFDDADVRFPDVIPALRDVVAGHKARILPATRGVSG